MDLPELRERLRAWHKRRFPEGVSAAVTFLKVGEEFGELSKAILWQNDAEVIAEAGDLGCVLAHLCRGLGGDLFDAMGQSVAKCERRLMEGKQ